jgi:uncharacterized protein YfaS (alpha-2-macroglobulin family)
MTILALDACSSAAAGGLDKLAIHEIGADGAAKDVSTLQASALKSGAWSASAARVDFVNGSDRPAWWIAGQSGYDRNAAGQTIKNGLEIVREYTNADGKPLDKITVGQEIEVHLKIRATGEDEVSDVAIVDLLPGGFDPVLADPPAAHAPHGGDEADADSGDDGDADKPQWRSPVGLSASSWKPEYADIREDRVVIYGQVATDVREFVYRIKASNVGHFIAPPAYGEAMYDRRVQAQSPGGATLTVVPAGG